MIALKKISWKITEYILIFDDHPHFLIKDIIEKKDIKPGGGRVEFYQWHW